MKHYKLKAVAIALACALATPLVGCAKDDDSAGTAASSLSSEEIEALLKTDLQIGVIAEDGGTGTTTAPAATTTTETVTTVTDDAGNAYVAVTDAQGTTVTDAAGDMVTEPYVAPTTTTTTEGGSTGSYTAKIEKQQALWIDMTQRKDFVFDGELLTFTFKVKDDAPDGVYDIEIVHTDFANYDAQSLEIAAYNGSVGVNTNVTDSTITNSAFYVSASSVNAKQGDTVEIVVNVGNNPGFCGFDLQFQYDCNALEYVSGGAGSDFSTKANISMN